MPAAHYPASEEPKIWSVASYIVSLEIANIAIRRGNIAKSANLRITCGITHLVMTCFACRLPGIPEVAGTQAMSHRAVQKSLSKNEWLFASRYSHIAFATENTCTSVSTISTDTAARNVPSEATWGAAVAGVGARGAAAGKGSAGTGGKMLANLVSPRAEARLSTLRARAKKAIGVTDCCRPRSASTCEQHTKTHQ